jgi:NAD(P)-dependent dehydrogenase (short-subunit alcohol dehydrogenase family)
MCETCGEYNIRKRNQTADLNGKIAIVTGARIKIGFQIALKLLRAGCVVIATTRYPSDAFERYSSLCDFNKWSTNLLLVKVDFVNRSAVESFCSLIASRFPKIDILINNAAQTIKRDATFYAQLEAKEEVAKKQQMLIECGTEIITPVGETAIFPCDKHNQPLDLRTVNSWVTTLDNVNIDELLEVQIVNCTVPFILIQRFTPLLTRNNGEHGFIINVSAMEGVFDQSYKSARHPHTNIAKAGLNMITRTSGADYLKRHHIAMNSVDTGFITNEFPMGHTHHSLEPPLDEEDGASRVVDPIFVAFNTKCVHAGIFFKDYMVSKW